MQGFDLWGFKDPRTLLVLEEWLKDLPHAEFVGIFRHPVKVADSLYKRNKMSYNQAFDLWLRYNRKLWYYKKQYGFPIIEFVDEAEKMQNSISLLVEKLALPNPKTQYGFWDSSLTHSKTREIELPKEISVLYNSLKSVCHDSE